MNPIREVITEAEIEAAHDNAKELAARVLELLGMHKEPDGEYYFGNVSLAVAGGALGIAAGKLMAAASDESFRRWLKCVRRERQHTGVERPGVQ